ncbi:hypothetical protein [Paraburkholderia terricola]|uniref:Uncharacterized protein n=1 Tax=Paraburkholderia terricola TaxID=169427 RepID=A0A1M6XME1_9BURK|nr:MULTISPECIES: hypothetical protein [Paraburkholderia]SDP29753.1 hypothetical protein SAMN05192547_105737 [Paraburkholderia sediminicola]SHL07134.1 hypothetical protein SAMN05192548_105736 [Paraburkholderia terricola]
MSTVPQEISKETVFGWFQHAILDRQNDVLPFFREKGGWENCFKLWMSGQLRQLPGHPEVRCEQHIYGNAREAVDLLVETRTVPPQFICIELKAESFFHSAKQERVNAEHVFFQSFENDLRKLRRVQLQNALGLAVAICITGSAAGPLETRGYQSEVLSLNDRTNVTIFISDCDRIASDTGW